MEEHGDCTSGVCPGASAHGEPAGPGARRASRPCDATRHHHPEDHARGGQVPHPADRAVDHHRGGGQGQNGARRGDAGAGACAPQGGARGGVCLPYLLSRLGGGSIFGTLTRGVVDESKMPLQALAGYRAIFGAHATPALMVYDRGGRCHGDPAGARPRGGQGDWHAAQRPRGVARGRGRPRDGPQRRKAFTLRASNNKVHSLPHLAKIPIRL